MPSTSTLMSPILPSEPATSPVSCSRTLSTLAPMPSRTLTASPSRAICVRGTEINPMSVSHLGAAVRRLDVLADDHLAGRRSDIDDATRRTAVATREPPRRRRDHCRARAWRLSPARRCWGHRPSTGARTRTHRGACAACLRPAGRCCRPSRGVNENVKKWKWKQGTKQKNQKQIETKKPSLNWGREKVAQTSTIETACRPSPTAPL